MLSIIPILIGLFAYSGYIYDKKIIKGGFFRVPSEEELTMEWLSHASIKELIDPQQLADMMVFLASPLADFITGIYLPIDGGWLVL